LFIQADLDAAKAGIARFPESEIPKLGPVLLKGWHFFLPFAVLIYSLFWLNHEPEVAAIWASLTVMILGLTIGYNGKRMQLGEIWNNLIGTGIGALDIFMVSAGAGFIMGMLQVTGLGFALTQMLVHVGEGSVILLLIFAAIMCIILGMGMPTIGVYVLLAVLIAPSLQKVGIPPMASHMFILYMGLMSMVTPPVAVAAFFAASLAKADQMKTGWVAVRFSWAAYIVPFLFVFSPTLLLQSSSILDITLAFVTAVAGVWVMCAGMVGYSFLPLGWPERIGLLTGGFGLLLPHELGAWAWWCNGLGLVLSLALLGLQWMRAKRRAGAALAQS
ncbi:MAG: TRAP transporter large permease subunit, partial [Alphaproteobacteria bacterium]|nr:TRAP transporter large permease subunit [Alphaproteobacteria bacterium]